MIDPGEAFAGVRAKVARARTHLEHLDTQINAFVDRHGYTIRKQPNTKPEEWVYELQLLEPIPIEWSIILGEVVHNLRSALDNAVYQLVIDEQGKSYDGTGFPIFTTSEAFDQYGRRQMRYLGEATQTFIESLQPYDTAGNLTDHLRLLHRLWTQDKHRLVQPWGIQITDDRQITFDPPPRHIVWNDAVLHDGTEAVRAIWDADPLQVKVDGHFGIHIAFEDPAGPGAGLDSALWSTYDYLAGIISILISMVGHQDRSPLPSTTEG